MKRGLLGRRIGSIVLFLALLMGCVPVTGSKVYADTDTYEKTIAGFDTSVIANPKDPGDGSCSWQGSYVYYGTYNGSPVKYRVLSNSTTDFGGTTMLLDSDRILYIGSFDEYYECTNVWADSKLKTELNGMFLSENFSAAEQTAIASSTKASKNSNDGTVQYFTYAPLGGEKIFVLDAGEVANTTYGYSSTNGKDGIIQLNRTKGGAAVIGWLLRSPYTNSSSSDAVSEVSVYGGAGNINSHFAYTRDGGVSPAMNIDLSRILFVSCVKNGDWTVDSNSVWVGPEYKLTLSDSRKTVQVTGGQSVAMAGDGTVTVPYTYTDGATADAEKVNRISVLITNKEYTGSGAQVLYYGALQNIQNANGSASTVAEASVGTGTFSMPSDLWSKTLGTDYHLYILAEHVNDSKATDYAGVPVEIRQIGHQHTWTFSASDAEITAYCTNRFYDSYCQYQGTANCVRLSLSADDADYSGKAYSGASKKDGGIASITGYAVGDLFYEGTGSTGYNKTKMPPVNAGTYKATVSITRNGETAATAEKAFEIRKVNPGYTAPVGLEQNKTGSPLELIQAGTAAGGSMEYSLDQTSWSTDVPKATQAGSYTVYYRVRGDENHNDSEVRSVTAKIQLIQMKDIQASGYSGVYDGKPHGITVDIGSNAGATVTYGTTKENCTESSLTYTNAGTYTIFYKVSKENCADVSGSETVQIDPAEITVTAEDAEKTYGEKDPEFSYQITSGDLVKDEKLSGIQLTRTEGEDVTEDGYVITPSQQEGANGNYCITFENGTFTILQKTIGIEWGTTTFVYNGAPQKPAAAATGMAGTEDLSLTVTGEQTGAGTGYEAKVTGITGEKAGNYRLPEKGVTTTFQIDRAGQNVPATAAGAAETVSKKGDGKITGVTSEMEYRKAGETAYTRAAGTEIQNLDAGTYYVRYASSANYNASDDAEVTVGAGRRLRVTLPENQTGYTLTASASQLDWHGSTDLTFTLADGYSMTEKFAVRVNGTPIAAKNGKYRISNMEEDSVITVEGVADITAPIMKITVGENTWASFLNKITFNLYFQKSAEVVITAEEVNTGSGLKDVHYYAADHEMTLNEVKALPDTAWTKYTGKFRIDAERKYVIYAKAADRDGNVVYISSGGMVIDRTLPTVAGIENGESCYGNFSFTATDDNLVEVIIDEKTAAPEADGRYTIPADNREHVVVVADPAGNRLEYRVTVYQIYTVTYVADGVTISTQQIGYGKNAAAPEIPAKAGYNETAPRWDKDGRNITADTTITAVYVENEPGEFQNTTPADNAGGAKLKEDTEALKKAVPLTAEEQKLIHTGADVKIWLEVKDISATVSAKDVSLVSTKLNGSTAGMYLDVNLYKQVGTNPPEKITRLNQKVTITFALPERIINTDSNVTRTYQVIRVHNQSAEVLDVVPDAKNNTLSFATDRFSTCAVAYKDVKNSAVTYKIKATAGKGGKISPSGTVKVKEGAGKTFRITPNAGYEIDTLTVDGKKVKAKTSYKFSKVKGAHTIKVTFKKKSAESTDPKEPEAPKDPEDPKAPEDPKPSEDNKKPSAEDIQKNSDKLNITTLVTWEGSKIKVTWGKIEEADGYDIFAVRCGKELDSRSLVKSVKKTTFSVVLTKISGAKLVKQRGYKVKVKAYKMIGGKKCYIGSSSSYHVVSKENKSYTNAKKVAVSEKSVVIKKGKTSQIHAEIRKASEKKKLLSKIHGPELRYYSSNTEIATVTEKGRIKAKKKGTCFVYAVALNGVKARVAVTVK